jgi:indolepyruvate ferredoxin oxidoreductase beta subunit
MTADPYNIIITGVGGQGNVLAARVLGSMLVNAGRRVTIGETFGATQRGGSVMSHLRVSHDRAWSPQIPRGMAHLIASLEPAEAVRVLKDYGNRRTVVLSNTRPVYPVSVIAGEIAYPPVEEIEAGIEAIVSRAYFIDATEEAVKLGNPILSNIMMLGALAGIVPFPMGKRSFTSVIRDHVPAESLPINLKAFDRGRQLVNLLEKVSGKSHGRRF